MDIIVPKTGQVLTRCEDRMLVFCALDAYGSYDMLGIELGRQHPNRVLREQVKLMNDSMRARSPYDAWEASGLLSDEVPGLAALPPDADLAEMPDEEWHHTKAQLKAAYERVMRPQIGAAAATKILYLHRPRLVAITDAEVAEFFACQRLPPVDRALAVAEGIRELARFNGNRAALDSIQEHLASRTVGGKPIAVSKARILDALVWMKQRKAYERLWEAYGWQPL
jgi:hypothetical protein